MIIFEKRPAGELNSQDLGLSAQFNGAGYPQDGTVQSIEHGEFLGIGQTLIRLATMKGDLAQIFASEDLIKIERRKNA